METLVAAMVERMGRFPEDRVATYDRLWEQQDFRYREGEPREAAAVPSAGGGTPGTGPASPSPPEARSDPMRRA